MVLCSKAKIYSLVVHPVTLGQKLTLGQKISSEFCKTIDTSKLRETASIAVFLCTQMILHKSHAWIFFLKKKNIQYLTLYYQVYFKKNCTINGMLHIAKSVLFHLLLKKTKLTSTVIWRIQYTIPILSLITWVVL